MCLIGSHAVESAAANGCQQQADVADGRDHSGASSNVVPVTRRRASATRARSSRRRTNPSRWRTPPTSTRDATD